MPYEVEKAQWKSLKHITTNFAGNNKTENYHDMAAYLVQSYKAIGCNAFLRLSLRILHRQCQGSKK
jgi:hypothetical protein